LKGTGDASDVETAAPSSHILGLSDKYQ
jgi:hypothetical protein